MKKLLITMLFIVAFMLYGCSTNTDTKNNTLTVFSAGDYINPDIIPMFEEETGIKVIYEEYDTNENMYTKVSSANSTYDVVCTSDYMISRFINEGLIQPYTKSNIPNINNMDEEILKLSKNFDPNLEYTVPYAYGTLGILYNSKYVTQEEASSWNILWNEKYKDEILMTDSVRDIMAVALKKNGFSLNSSNDNELNIALNDLLKQKPLVQAYVIDQAKDKMISEEAKLAVIYSGEALFTKDYNENLEYEVPKEGSNLWIDSWVIMKNSTKKNLAEMFINFMARPDIAAQNYEYLTYSTPNIKALELVTEPSLIEDPAAVPTTETLERCEIMKNLGLTLTKKYNEIFMKVKIE